MKRKLFLAGCWATLITGALHTFGHVQMMHMPTQGADPTETQLLTLMQTYRDAATGRTTLELMLGFSMLFSILCFGLGILGLLSARGGGLQTLIVRFNAVMLGLMLTASLLYFFLIPTTCLAMAFAFFAAAAAIRA